MLNVSREAFCLMFQGKHSAIQSPFVIKMLVLSIFEFYIGFIVCSDCLTI